MNFTVHFPNIRLRKLGNVSFILLLGKRDCGFWYQFVLVNVVRKWGLWELIIKLLLICRKYVNGKSGSGVKISTKAKDCVRPCKT